MTHDDLPVRLDDRWLDASRSAFDCATCGLAANDLAEAAAALRELVAERDALRALLRDVRGHIESETSWCYDAPEGWLEDRVDAALGGDK